VTPAGLRLELWIDIARSAAAGMVAGNILESALFLAARTDFGRTGKLNRIAALKTFPERIVFGYPFFPHVFFHTAPPDDTASHDSIHGMRSSMQNLL